MVRNGLSEFLLLHHLWLCLVKCDCQRPPRWLHQPSPRLSHGLCDFSHLQSTHGHTERALSNQYHRPPPTPGVLQGWGVRLSPRRAGHETVPQIPTPKPGQAPCRALCPFGAAHLLLGSPGAGWVSLTFPAAGPQDNSLKGVYLLSK